MVTRKILVLIAVLLFFSTAYAQVYTHTLHSIEITVDKEGRAAVVERFFLVFPNARQLLDFRDKSTELGVDLQKWNEFDSKIYPHIGAKEDVRNAFISLIEEPQKYLELRYALADPLMTKAGETSRIVTYALDDGQFREYDTGSFIVIPQSTIISIILPTPIEIVGTISPDATFANNTVTWTGYKSTNNLALKYNLFKQIASQFEVSKAISGFLASDYSTIVLIALLAVIITLYMKRRKIAGRMENYIIEHSELAPKTEEPGADEK